MCTVHVALVVDECYFLTHLRLAKTIIYAMTEAQKQKFMYFIFIASWHTITLTLTLTFTLTLRTRELT